MTNEKTKAPDSTEPGEPGIDKPTAKVAGLKALLAAAPLDGVDLTRSADVGREGVEPITICASEGVPPAKP